MRPVRAWAFATWEVNGPREDSWDILFLAIFFYVHLLVPVGANTFQIFEAFKTQLRLPFFTEILITVCLSI